MTADSTAERGAGRGQPRSGGGYMSPPFLRPEGEEKSPELHRSPGIRRTAATYSPNWWVSTIGAGELNGSVRNGKRWILTAVTTVLYYLREKTFKVPSGYSTVRALVALLATSRLYFLSGKSLGPLVQVS